MKSSAGKIPDKVTADEIKQAFRENLRSRLGRPQRFATKNDLYLALALTVRDRLLERTVETMETYGGVNARRVAYLSAEYLPGPHLANNLLNLGITEVTHEALRDLGYDFDQIVAQEEEPGLGNGGLGRLASCFMDSLASVEVPAIGYGIRYEFGIFDQVIRDGWQEEITDKWLGFGNPWEIARADIAYSVKFGGHSETLKDQQGTFRVWIPDTEVKGVAYDTPIAGYGANTCDVLRLWKAEAVESFDFTAFNHGDYY
jgi:glycogen phosphorylase